jgi:hypothetical protein
MRGKSVTPGIIIMTLIVVLAFALYPLAAIGQQAPGDEKTKMEPKAVPPKGAIKPMPPKAIDASKLKAIKKPPPPPPRPPAHKLPPKGAIKPMPPKAIDAGKLKAIKKPTPAPPKPEAEAQKP